MAFIISCKNALAGNETMERLQQIFALSSQKYGSLILDLHCNRFGPTALFQVSDSYSCVLCFNGLLQDLITLHEAVLANFSICLNLQICECPVIVARLEVLNLSQNRLTDACSSYLCAILENCKGMFTIKCSF